MKTLLKKMKNNARPQTMTRVHCPSGLAVTPSEMVRMSEQGIPISSQVLSPDQFNDGDMSNRIENDPIYTRGVTANDLWENSKRSKSRLKSAHNKFVNNVTD